MEKIKVGFLIDKEVWVNFLVKCRIKKTDGSKVLRQTVKDFLEENEGETE